VQPSVEPEGATAEKRGTEDETDEEKVEALAREDAPVEDGLEGGANGDDTAPEVDGPAIKLGRNFEEVGESENGGGQNPTRAQAESPDEFGLEKTSKKGFLQQRDNERGNEGFEKEFHDTPDHQMGAGVTDKDKVETDDGLHGDESGGPTEEELPPRRGFDRPELAQKDAGPEKSQSGKSGDQERPVHGTVKWDVSGEGKIEERTENHRAKENDEKEEDERLFS